MSQSTQRPEKNEFIENYVKQKRYFFQKRISFALIFFQLLITGSFILLMRVGTDQVLIKQAQSIISNSVARVASTIEGRFQGHAEDVEYFSGLIEKTRFNLSSLPLRDALFSGLEAKPYFDAIYFVNHRNEFFLASRTTTGPAHARLMTSMMRYEPNNEPSAKPGKEQMLRTRRYYDAQGNAVKVHRDTRSYRADTRPWYKRAKASPGEVVWVGPYVVADNERRISFAAAQALNDDPYGGEVVTVDLTVSDLSQLLSQNLFDQRVTDIIFDNKGQVIATGKSLQFERNNDSDYSTSSPYIPHILELNNPLLNNLFECFQRSPELFNHHHASRPIHCPGQEDYIMAASMVNIVSGSPWYIVSVGDERDFLEVVRSSEATNLILVSVITVFAIAMAISISGRLTKPLLSLHLKAMTDRLTGLLNRRGLESQVAMILGEGKHRHPQQAVAIVDIDRFKLINDEHGHDVGDLVIQDAANRIQRITKELGVCARLGGEEFALLLDVEHLDQAKAALETLRLEIEQHAVPSPKGDIHYTVSIGASAIVDTCLDAWESALKSADIALYQAKNAGRNRCEFTINDAHTAENTQKLCR